MAFKPVELPRFASVDTFDGPVGQINFAEPTESKKDRGWGFGEFPPREHMNWVHRRTFEWVDYLQETAGRRNLRYFNNQN